jgi:hypothetical protein
MDPGEMQDRRGHAVEKREFARWMEAESGICKVCMDVG